MMREPMILEGYASLFGVADLAGDVVRTGAFAKSLRKRPRFKILLEHDPRLVAGAWVEAHEDKAGLFVRGSLVDEAPAAALARRRLRAGVDGLSIGFRTVRARALPGGGRELIEIDLIEVSLVRTPMLPAARLFHPGGDNKTSERNR